MERTATVLFDGENLKPIGPIDMKPNTEYVIRFDDLVLEVAKCVPRPDGRTAWDVLRDLAGTVEAPEDWSAEHDHYLYGSPKRGSDPNR